MNRIKKLGAVILSTLTVTSACVVGGSMSAGASGTGAGLAEWSLNAYYSGWSYVWGGATPGAVDCSGLIYSYCGGNRTSMLSDAQANGRDWGYVSSGVPRVHGLGLYRPGHVGVYIEDGMEVDARGDDYGVCYQEIGGWNNWDCWFKLTAVSYPDNGWEEFNGNYYYYENGEYIVNTQRTIDGETYYFDSKGHSGKTPTDTSAVAEAPASSGSSDNSGSSDTQSQSKPTTWSKGSNDDEVVKIQKRLAELGYYNGAIDGDFGELTDAAFRAFQAAAGLFVDGIAGSDREVLYSDNAPAKPEEKVEETTQAPAEQPAEEAPAEETPAQEATEEAPTEPAPAYPVEGDFTNAVADLQYRLADLGYFGIEITGYFGDYTSDAVMSFQLANGLIGTGELDEETYALLFSDDAVAYTAPEVEAAGAEAEQPAQADAQTESETEEQSAETPAVPSILRDAVAATQPAGVVSDSQTYSESAVKAVEKANKVTEKALEKSSALASDSATAQVKRSANVWIWLVLVAVILGVAALVLLKRDKKTRYQRYTEKKKRNAARAQLNARW